MSYVIEDNYLRITNSEITQNEFNDVCANNYFTKLECFPEI